MPHRTWDAPAFCGCLLKSRCQLLCLLSGQKKTGLICPKDSHLLRTRLADAKSDLVIKGFFPIGCVKADFDGYVLIHLYDHRSTSVKALRCNLYVLPQHQLLGIRVEIDLLPHPPRHWAPPQVVPQQCERHDERHPLLPVVLDQRQ